MVHFKLFEYSWYSGNMFLAHILSFPFPRLLAIGIHYDVVKIIAVKKLCSIWTLEFYYYGFIFPHMINVLIHLHHWINNGGLAEKVQNIKQYICGVLKTSLELWCQTRPHKNCFFDSSLWILDLATSTAGTEIPSLTWLAFTWTFDIFTNRWDYSGLGVSCLTLIFLYFVL